MARRVRVEVSTAWPDASPEYIRSLSRETKRDAIGEEWDRSR